MTRILRNPVAFCVVPLSLAVFPAAIGFAEENGSEIASESASRIVVLGPLDALGITPRKAQKVRRWLNSSGSKYLGQHWIAAARFDRLLKPKVLAEVLRNLKGQKIADVRAADDFSADDPGTCLAEPICVGVLGRRLGADAVVLGEVGSLGADYLVYLRLVDRSGRVLRAVSGVLEPKKKLRAATRLLLVRLIFPERYCGTLRVSVSVPQAWIYLNGKRVGRSPVRDLKQIPVGTYALRVTHEDCRDFVRFVRVKYKRTTAVDVDLSAYAVHARKMRLSQERTLRSDEMPWYRRWWAVAGFGAAIAVGTTVVVALLPRSIKHDRAVTVFRP